MKSKKKEKPKAEKKARAKKVESPIAGKLLAFLNARPHHKYTVKQLVKSLKTKSHKDRVELEKAAEALVLKGLAERIHGDQYRSVNKAEELVGIVDFVNPSFGFIVVEGREQDIWVSAKNMHGAYDGDTVKIRIYDNSRRDRPEGEVMEIIKRKTDEFAGKIEISPRFAFVVPSNRKVYTDIFVYPEYIKGAKDGDKVIVKIKEWSKDQKSPIGRVTRVLGKSGENNVEIHSIMFEFGLPFEFPEEVEKEAEKIPEKITKAEIKKRRDLRDTTTFTIDPVNAKDFDDALSVKKIGEQLWEIGIHIADVTHYVVPGTILEKEAADRATSVYLVDRTIPMLPEKLSNNLCSLRPHEDKLTFSAIFHINEQGHVLEEWFGRTVIHSDRRFTYEEAQEIIESSEGEFADELRLLNDLAIKMREKRFKTGAISFESVEYFFELDDQGKPLRMVPKERKDAHKLVEEFMLLANKKVAEFVYGLRKGRVKNTMVYRVHEDPDPDKVTLLYNFVKRFGHTIQTEGKALAHSLNRLADTLEGKPEQNIVTYQAIRTMSKARYTTEPLGHYGLAFKHYSHFTSPIRRYPDMMVHRLLQHYLDQGQPADAKLYEDLCKHSSEREKRAADAERASIKYKQVEYMAQFVDREMTGFITGLTDWGIFVELNETRCEGMIRLSDLQDDQYYFDEEKLFVIGRKYKETYFFGDKVTVRVKGVNLDKRTIDLTLL